MTTTPRRILIVSCFHPPSPGPGGTRWASMSRHLRAMGHSVTVVASGAWGGLPDDAELGIVRVHDLTSARWLRRLLRRGELSAAGGPALAVPPPSALLTKVLVPDMQVVTWLPFMFPVVRRLVLRREVDCLVTTSPLETVHVAGLLLGPRRPAWIADFRDGWNFEPWRERFPTAAQRRLDGWLERRVARKADVAVGATRPIADDLERRLGARAVWVPNGWDPSGPPPSPSPSVAGAEAGVVTLVYTGALSGAWGRDPEPLLHALRLVRGEPERLPVRLVHAGHVTTDEQALIAKCGVADAVEHVGILDRSSAYALQRTADALVLLTSRNTSEATSKVYEYAVAGRPIVALAEGNEAERIVRETNTGVTVPPTDVEAIAAALRRVASGELRAAYAPRNLERFTYPGPAEAMAELVETAVRRRAAG